MTHSFPPRRSSQPADSPLPHRLVQSHAMLFGTTGAGKTTQLRDLTVQMRQRQDNAVVFDLTGAYVEAFYDPERDTILNPMDQRCPAWTIFNDCTSYSHFTARSEEHTSELQSLMRSSDAVFCLK